MKRQQILENGPFQLYLIERNGRWEGYAFYPKENLVDPCEWGINKQNVILATEDYIVSLNSGIADNELTLEDCLTNPDWKPFDWIADNPPQLTAFDYFFNAEELQLPLQEKINLVDQRQNPMVCRYIAYMLGIDYFEVLHLWCQGKRDWI